MERTRKIILQIKTLLLIIAACIAMTTYGDNGEVDSGDLSVLGISIGDSLEDVQSRVAENCESPETIYQNTPSFPLAETTEVHVVCKNLSGGGSLAVVLADDAAVHIHAKDLDAKNIATAGEKSTGPMGYSIYGKGRLWVNEQSKKTVLISADAIHPNLYVWENPYLSDLADQEKETEANPHEFPAVLMFGQSYAEVKAAIQDSCDPIREHETDVWLLNKPKQQRQIDCYNYDYLGFPRKFELVFGDDVLQLAWILTAKQEEARVRAQLRAIFGEPMAANQIAEVYSGGRIALRLDKPEVLALSEEVLPLYLEMFSKGGQGGP